MPGGHASASQLLELNLLSARDLATVSKSMKAFAVVWINPDRKLETRADQTGLNNPTWNEKLAFRVDDDFLGGDSSTVTIEIRASTRRGNVVLVGSVGVLVTTLFPPSTTASSQKRIFSRMRFLTLQIRRPSGRPQGVLDVGVALLDGNRRSMPLSSDLSVSGYGNSDLIETRNDKERKHRKNFPKIKLLRSKSERSVSKSYLLKPKNSSLINESDLGKEKDSLLSDVGPSPSVVAAAIAMGLYPAPVKASAAMEDRVGSSILEDWTEEDDSVEGLKTKIERWRSEIHPWYQNQINKNMSSRRENYKRSTTQRRKEQKKELRRGGSGLFSCFGTAYGCEFSITCGGGGSSRRKSSRLDADDVHLSLSEVQYNDHYV